MHVLFRDKLLGVSVGSFFSHVSKIKGLRSPRRRATKRENDTSLLKRSHVLIVKTNQTGGVFLDEFRKAFISNSLFHLVLVYLPPCLGLKHGYS